VPADDDATLLAANQAFYDAHESRDLAAMADIWHSDDRVVCVHPGWPILRGRQAVMESWRRIFDGPGRSQFILTGLTVEFAGDVAWVSLEENLIDRTDTHAVAATNVYLREGGVWKLVVHHASPVALA
jgi:ketosteroid isomerase-like protein